MTNQKKINQIEAGRKARQDGENVKNILTSFLSYSPSNTTNTTQSLNLIRYLKKNISDIKFIQTTSQSDGKTKCAKVDIKATVEFNNKPGEDQKKEFHKLSVKSTYGKTQVAVHSISTLTSYLAKKKIIIPSNVIEFLTLFTDSKAFSNIPTFIFSESQRRERFSFEEINSFNPQLFLDTQQFFEQHADVILRFLISEGSDKRENFADILAFCDKKINNLMLCNIDNIIYTAISVSNANKSFCLPNKPRKNSGVTTLSLYGGLISLQMKGSGTGAAYHGIQFNIAGNFIKKWKQQGLLKD